MLRLNLLYINDLSDFLNEIDTDLFVSVSSKHLFSGSIGAHTRHVIEFYHQFLISFETKFIDYDGRERNLKLETDKAFALSALKNITHFFNKNTITDSELLDCNSNNITFKTSIGRELSYLSEHTIHHFALIRLIAESKGFSFVKIPNFGIAQSTLHYRTLQNN